MKKKKLYKLIAVSFILWVGLLLASSGISPARGYWPLDGLPVYFPLLIRQPGISPTPTPSLTPTLTPTPTATPVPPKVVLLNTHSSYRSNSGSLHIVGEVHNELASAVSEVAITVKLLDRNGHSLKTQTDPIYMDELPAGETTCFDVIFVDFPSGWSDYRIEAPEFSNTSETIPTLSILERTGTYDSSSGFFKIQGSVRNNQGARVECVKLIGSLFKKNGEVLGCNYTYVDSYHLYSGQTNTFTLEFQDRNYSDVEAFRLQPSGHLP